MKTISSLVQILFPRVEGTPEAAAYGKASSKGFFLAAGLALICGLVWQFSSKAEVLDFVDFLLSGIGFGFKLLVAVEAFFVQTRIQLGVLLSMSLLLIFAELRTLNLVAGLEAKERPNLNDVESALRLERSLALMRQTWFGLVVGFALLSIVAWVPKIWWRIDIDVGMTIVTIGSFLGICIAWQSPLTFFLVHKDLRRRAVKNYRTREKALHVCHVGAWSDNPRSLPGLSEYLALYLYLLAQKANCPDLLIKHMNRKK